MSPLRCVLLDLGLGSMLYADSRSLEKDVRRQVDLLRRVGNFDRKHGLSVVDTINDSTSYGVAARVR